MATSSGSLSPYCCFRGHVMILRSTAMSVTHHCPNCNRRIEFSRFPDTPRAEHCHMCLMPITKH